LRDLDLITHDERVAYMGDGWKKIPFDVQRIADVLVRPIPPPEKRTFATPRDMICTCVTGRDGEPNAPTLMRLLGLTNPAQITEYIAGKADAGGPWLQTLWDKTGGIGERFLGLYYNFAVCYGAPDVVQLRLNALAMPQEKRAAFCKGGWKHSKEWFSIASAKAALLFTAQMPARAMPAIPAPLKRVLGEAQLVTPPATKRPLDEPEAAPEAKRRRRLTEPEDLGLPPAVDFPLPVFPAPSLPVPPQEVPTELDSALLPPPPPPRPLKRFRLPIEDELEGFGALVEVAALAHALDGMTIVEAEVVMDKDDEEAPRVTTPPTADDEMEIDVSAGQACHRCGKDAVFALKTDAPFCDDCRCKSMDVGQHPGLHVCKRGTNEACSKECLYWLWLYGKIGKKAAYWVKPVKF